MTTPQFRPDWDDSIDLRKWIDGLIRHWYLIVGIFVVVVGAAGVYSFMVQTPRFEATASAVLPAANPADGSGLSPREYRELATSTLVIEDMLRSLEWSASPASVRNQLTATTSDSDGTITIVAHASSAQEAHSLANRWVDSYGRHGQKEITDRFQEMEAKAIQQVDSLLPELQTAEEALGRFDIETPLGTRENRLATLENQLNSTETQLSNLIASEANLDPTLREYLVGVLSENYGTAGGGGEPAGNGQALAKSIISIDTAIEPEDIGSNPVYQELSERLVQSRLSTLEGELVQAEIRLRQLRDLTIPAEQAKVAALESLLNQTPETIPDPALMSSISPSGQEPNAVDAEGINLIPSEITNPEFLRRKNELTDSTFQLSIYSSEAEALEQRILGLNGEVETHRLDLVTRISAKELREQQEASEKSLTLASNIQSLRSETRSLREQLARDRSTRGDLEENLQKINAKYQPAQAELNRLSDIAPKLGSISSLSAISEPSLPTAPVSPQRKRNLMLSGALGLMLGVFAALMVEFYRSSPPVSERRPD